MAELILYVIIALLAGMLLNVMSGMLPVIPFKIQAVIREIGGDIRSRLFAVIFLVLGSLGFILLLGCTALPYSLLIDPAGRVVYNQFHIEANRVVALMADLL